MSTDTFCPDHAADFELRMLRTDKKVYAGGFTFFTREHVILQFRKLLREADPIDARVSGAKAQRWTEWADVPLVMEQLAAKD